MTSSVPTVWLDPASAVFEAMWDGCVTQERAQILKTNTIEPRLEPQDGFQHDYGASHGPRSHHWYDYGVTESFGTEKLSATVPKGLAAQIRERAGRGNVSAYVTHALLRQLEHDRLGDLVAELEQVHGPVTDDEVAAARSEWPQG